MSNMNARNVVLATLAASVLTLSGCGSKKPISTVPASAEEARRPNVLLIVADDMGYSDIGAFGGEVKTRISMRLRRAASKPRIFTLLQPARRPAQCC